MRSSSAMRLLFVCLVAVFTFGLSAQSSDPFALTPPLVSQAITSCGDLTVSSGMVDSATATSRGNVLANGNVKVTGGTVNGDAVAGPGKTVTRSGSGAITGAVGSATAAFPCSIIDLGTLTASLASANDNATIPLSAQHKNPVSGAGDFTLSGGDSLTLQAGTYYFRKFTMSGGSTISLAGPVRILTTSDVNVTGGSVTGANPWQLHFWSSGTKFVVSSSTFKGFVYAPSAAVTVSSGTVAGGIYGGSVTVSGNSHVTRTIDDTPPVVTILSPLDHDAVVDLSQVAVHGTVTDSESGIASFQVNGADVSLASDGSFTVTLNLSTATPPTITATATNAAGLSSTSTVTVQSSLTHLTVAPSSLSIDQNTTGQLAATGTYADGSTADLTLSATWTTSAPSIATVHSGAVSAVSPGTTTIIATLGSFSASATVTVNPLLQSITVAPAAATVILGGHQQFTATGNYSGGSTRNLTGNVTWSTSDPALASVDGVGMTTALRPGTVAVRASAGSITGSASLTITASVVALEISSPATTFTAGDSVPFNALARLSDGSSIDVSKLASWSTADSSVATADANGTVTGSAAGTTSVTATYNSFSASVQLQINALETVTVSAPPLDRTVVQPLIDTIRFLYSGASPVQTGVAPDTIQERRVATIRGTVHDRAGHPIAGVEVTVVHHPEYGKTVTRADGVFDLALNGGGAVTLALKKAGYIEAQRLVATQWNDQQVVDDVVMIGFDVNVNAVVMGAASDQVARGSSVSDADGARQATLIFPAGEAATITASDGTVTTPATLHVRATEFTIGASGPKAMPAALPPSSGYTYCVELSADEAPSGRIQFTKPLALYIDNFLNFPVGTDVPVGYYDRTAAGWTASSNGRVVKILAVTNGQAVLDTNGDGAADDSSVLTALGIDSAELTALASAYSAGQSLWRCSINHFTPWDTNWPVLPPPDGVPPNQNEPQWIPAPATSCQVCEANAENASTVNMADQVYRETIPIQGTPYSLEYDSSRAARTQYKTLIHLTGPTIPASLRRVDLKISIGGAATELSFPAQPNLDYTFIWNGLDAFGRPVQGARAVISEISYIYPITYGQLVAVNSAWDLPAAARTSIENGTAEMALKQTVSQLVGHFGVEGAGFGGWTFSGQKLYDGFGRAIYEAGGQRSADPQQVHDLALKAAAGTGACCGSPDGTLAANAAFDYIYSVAPAPDGSLYVIEDNTIRRVDPNGVLTTIAGTAQSGFTPDGGTAAGNPLYPYDIAVGPDGVLYVVDGTRVRAIIDGRWVTIAGNGSAANAANVDGLPATSVSMEPFGIAIGPDGSVYIASRDVYRVDPNRLIYRLGGLGGGNAVGTGDEGPARSAGMNATDVAVGRDGSVFVSDNETTVRRITPDGIIHRVGGIYGNGPLLQSGQTATSGRLWPRGMSVAPDGTLLVADTLGFRVWSIAPNGIATVLAGNGSSGVVYSSGFSTIPPAAGSFGRSVPVALPYQARIAADGSILINDLSNNVVRRADSAFPSAQSAGVVIPSDDGSTGYVFEAGRHTRTVDTLTGTTLETLAYDASGNLASITDVDGLVTTIERNGNGDATAIVAPNGQRTVLSVIAAQLKSVTDPSGAANSFDYDPSSGLLTKLTDRRGGLHQFTYDSDGLLARDTDPAGGFINLVRSGAGQNFSVTATTAEGRGSTYTNSVDGGANQVRTSTDSAGLVTSHGFYAGTTSMTAVDGTSVTTESTPDSRFGMMAPVASTTVSTGGKTLQILRTRSVTLTNPLDPLSLSSVTEVVKVNGKSWTSSYSNSGRLLIQQSPLGRQSSATLDAKGRVTLVHQPAVADTTIGYDTRGRVQQLAQGPRTTTFAYDGADRVQSITDPLHRTVSFTYDAANRVTSQTLPGGQQIGFTYDASGNVTSVTPPSRPQHVFDFTAVDLVDRYTPPALPGAGATSYQYNKDRQLTLVTRPDTTTIALHYDPAGRLDTLTTADTRYTYGYDTAGRLASASTSDGASLGDTYAGSLLTQQQWTGAVSGAVGFTYDDNLRVASENGVAFTYDDDGLLTGAGSLTIARDAQSGFVTGTTLGVFTDRYTYNTFGEMASYDIQVGGSSIFNQSYTRDDAGRITQTGETVNGHTTTTSYGYDPNGRLSDVTTGTATTHYDYDDNGNRTARTTAAGTESATYDAQDRMLTYNGETYTYTANGELQSKTDATGRTTYSYDALGNLKHVALPTGSTIDYVIDAQNRRVGKKVNGTLVQGWLYADQLRVIAETDGTGAIVSTFVYGTHSNVPDYMVRGGSTYRLITDHLGSPRFVVEASSNTLAETLTYDEFGNVLTDSNPGFQPFGFAGALHDQDTKLVRFGARDYDAQTGRWTSKDPIGLWSGDPNLYGYTFADPINRFDPSGLATAVVSIAGTAGAGGAVTAGEGFGVDSHGNVAWVGGAGGGGMGGISASTGVQIQFTNAPTIMDLAGISLNSGGSIEGCPVSVEHWTDARHHGLNIMVGPGVTPSLVETHSTVTNTWVQTLNSAWQAAQNAWSSAETAIRQAYGVPGR